MADARKNVRFIGNPGERFLSALSEYSTVIHHDHTNMMTTFKESHRHLGMKIVEQLLKENQQAQAKLEEHLQPIESRYADQVHPLLPSRPAPQQEHHADAVIVNELTSPLQSRVASSARPLRSSSAPISAPSPNSPPSSQPRILTTSQTSALSTNTAAPTAETSQHNQRQLRPSSPSRSTSHPSPAASSPITPEASRHSKGTRPASSQSPFPPLDKTSVDNTLVQPEAAGLSRSSYVNTTTTTSDLDTSGYGNIPIQPIELAPASTPHDSIPTMSNGHESNGSVRDGSVYSSASSTRRKRWTEAGGVSHPTPSILPPPPGVLRAQIQQQRSQQQQLLQQQQQLLQQQPQQGSVGAVSVSQEPGGEYVEELPLLYADGVAPAEERMKGGVVVALDVTFRKNPKTTGNKKIPSREVDQNTIDSDEEGSQSPENVPGGVLPGFTRRNSGFPGTHTGEIYRKRSPSMDSRASDVSRNDPRDIRRQSHQYNDGLHTEPAEDEPQDPEDVNIDGNKVDEDNDYGNRVHAARLKRMEERRVKAVRERESRSRESEDTQVKSQGRAKSATRLSSNASEPNIAQRGVSVTPKDANLQRSPGPLKEESQKGQSGPGGANMRNIPVNGSAKSSNRGNAGDDAPEGPVETGVPDHVLREAIQQLKLIANAGAPVAEGPDGVVAGAAEGTESSKTPKKKPLMTSSNKKLIMNALQYLCLAGNTHDQMRNDAVSKVTQCTHNHFVVLLKQTTTLKYSGIYISNISHGILYKLVGEGPDFILDKYILQYFKYDSAGKQWSLLPSQKLTLTTDAVTLNSKRNAQSVNKLVET